LGLEAPGDFVSEPDDVASVNQGHHHLSIESESVQ
jgi:hypothetical protein